MKSFKEPNSVSKKVLNTPTPTNIIQWSPSFQSPVPTETPTRIMDILRQDGSNLTTPIPGSQKSLVFGVSPSDRVVLGDIQNIDSPTGTMQPLDQGIENNILKRPRNRSISAKKRGVDAGMLRESLEKLLQDSRSGNVGNDIVSVRHIQDERHVKGTETHETLISPREEESGRALNALGLPSPTAITAENSRLKRRRLSSMTQIPSPKRLLISDEDSDPEHSQVLLKDAKQDMFLEHLFKKNRPKRGITTPYIVTKTPKVKSKSVDLEDTPTPLLSLSATLSLEETPRIVSTSTFIPGKKLFPKEILDALPSTPDIQNHEKYISNQRLVEYQNQDPLDFEMTPKLDGIPSSPIQRLDYGMSQDIDILPDFLGAVGSFDEGTTPSLDEIGNDSDEQDAGHELMTSNVETENQPQPNSGINEHGGQEGAVNLMLNDNAKPEDRQSNSDLDALEGKTNDIQSEGFETPKTMKCNSVYEMGNVAVESLPMSPSFDTPKPLPNQPTDENVFEESQYDTGIPTQALLDMPLCEDDEYADTQINTQFMAQISFSQFDVESNPSGKVHTDFQTAKGMYNKSAANVEISKASKQMGELLAQEQEDDGPLKCAYQGTATIRKCPQAPILKPQVVELFRPIVLNDSAHVRHEKEPLLGDKKVSLGAESNHQSFFDATDSKEANMFSVDEDVRVEVPQRTSNSTFGGFRTAGGKVLPPPSQQAKRIATTLFEGVQSPNDTDVAETPHPFKKPVPYGGGFTTGNGSKLASPTEKAKAKTRSLLKENDTNSGGVPLFPLPAQTPVKTMYSGFSTGSGKLLAPPTEKAKEIAKRLLLEPYAQEIESEQKEPVSEAPIVAPVTPIYDGFSTGAGKPLAMPSEKAKELAKRLLVEPDDKLIVTDPPQTTLIDDAQIPQKAVYGGFSTGSGRPLAPPTDKAKEMAKLLLLETCAIEIETEHNKSVPEVSLTTPVKTMYGGFSTGSGKPLAMPSEKAKELARRMLGEPGDKLIVTDPPQNTLIDIDDAQIPQKAVYGGFSTGSSRPLAPPTEKAKEMAKRLLLEPYAQEIEQGHKETVPEASIETPVKPMSGGFSTGSGKPLAMPSEKANELARRILVEPDDKLIVTDPPQKASTDDFQMPPKAVYGGFNTGSGRPLAPPTDKAKELAKHLLFEPCAIEIEQGHIPEATIATPVREKASSSNKILSAPEDFSKMSTPLLKYTTAFQTPIGRSSSKGHFKTATSKSNITMGIKNTPFRPPLKTPKPGQVYPKQDISVPTTPKLKPKAKSFFDTQDLHSRPGLQDYFKTISSTTREPGTYSSVNSQNAGNVEFEKNGKWGWNNARNEMLEYGCNELLASEPWVKNHYRWIVWKLASLMRSFDIDIWNPDQVLSQLLYRYEMEINQANRSCLKLMAEKDAVVGRHMVLCISNIDLENKFIELTDGWYAMPAVLDSPLSRQLKNGRLFIGQKLHIQTCTMSGSSEGRPVLEMGSETKLQLNANCTRRAKWAEYLGYQKTMIFPISISSILPDGGLVTIIDVVVSRKLPIHFVETLPSGNRVYRTAMAEEAEKQNYEKSYQDMVEKGQAYVLKEYPDGTANQLHVELREYIDEHLPPRNVRACYNLQVIDHPPSEEWKHRCEYAIVSIWDQAGLNEVSEGTRLKISHLQPGNYGKKGTLYNTLVLKSTNRTKVSELKPKFFNLFEPRQIIPCQNLLKSKRNSLVDLLIVILDTRPARFTENDKINVAGCDQTGHFVIIEAPNSVNFKAGSTAVFKNLCYIFNTKRFAKLDYHKYSEVVYKPVNPYREQFATLNKWHQENQDIKSGAQQLLMDLDSDMQMEVVLTQDEVDSEGYFGSSINDSQFPFV